MDVLNIIQYNCEIIAEVFFSLKKNKLFLKVDYLISGNVPRNFFDLPDRYIKIINNHLKPIPNNYLNDIGKMRP
ncbi:hypothetical protein ABVC55_03190 [Lactobacillus crispatus]